MSIKELKWEIDRQVADLNAFRQTIKQSMQKIKKTITKPSVVYSGLMVSFLVGYFFVNKQHDTVIAGEKNSLANSLSTAFSSPLFLLAITLLKNK